MIYIYIHIYIYSTSVIFEVLTINCQTQTYFISLFIFSCLTLNLCFLKKNISSPDKNERLLCTCMIRFDV